METNKQKETYCPSCGHVFERPDIIFTTEALVKEYGPEPVQCPNCKHIWGLSPKKKWWQFWK